MLMHLGYVGLVHFQGPNMAIFRTTMPHDGFLNVGPMGSMGSAKNASHRRILIAPLQSSIANLS
jgi:hypothetical protein